MAVSKLWPVTVRLATVLDYASNPEKTTKSKSKYSDADYQALRDVVAYAKDGEKTERELFCEGIHCNPQTAREQFVTVKEQFDKTDGIQAYHGYLSFEETDITPELAQQVGMAFAERMWGDRFQVLVTTHLNTEHLHCHFVVNSVSFRDGKRLQNKEKAWWYFRHIADEVCLEHGLSVVQNPEAYQSPRILTQKDKAGMPTRYNLARAALDEAIAMSHNLRQLEYHLSEMGYTLGSNPKRKYWTIKGKGDERPIRLHRLGEEYTKERITQRLIENRDNIDFEPFQPKTYRPKQYRLRTRSDRIGKVGGLYGLYLYYCYRLGYLPKYKAGQQNHARVSSLFFSFLFIKLTRFADLSPGGRCPVPVNLILDEFNNIGRIGGAPDGSDFCRSLSVIRSRDIRVMLAVQSLGQLQNRYPNNLWSEIIGNCDIQLMLGCTDDVTADYISDRSGEMCIVVDSTMTVKKTVAVTQVIPQYRETQGQGKRKLLTPDEVLRLPHEQMLVIIRGQNLLLLNKFDYTRHPMSKEMVRASIMDYCPRTSYAPTPQTGSENEPDKKPQRESRGRKLSRSDTPPVEF